MTVAIIGTGAVGLEWARAIHASRQDLQLVDPQPSQSSAAWAAEQGLAIQNELPEGSVAQIVLICVPGSLLPKVSDGVLSRAASGATVADLTTASAEAKQQAHRAAIQQGVNYVDIAINGAVSLTGVRTPLLSAGHLGEALEGLLAAVQAPYTHLEGSQPGDAIRVKLLRSVLTKGIEALAVEVLPAAAHYDCLDHLFTALGDVDNRPFGQLLLSMVQTHPQHARRRLAEVHEAEQQLQAAGAEPIVTQGVARRFVTSAADLPAAGLPEKPDLDQVLAALSAVGSAAR